MYHLNLYLQVRVKGTPISEIAEKSCVAEKKLDAFLKCKISLNNNEMEYLKFVMYHYGLLVFKDEDILKSSEEIEIEYPMLPKDIMRSRNTGENKKFHFQQKSFVRIY